MSSNRKRWIGLPFLGASEGKDHDQRESTRNGKKFLERNPRSTGAAVEREVTLSKTAADTFKDKDEEDIVQDYNSPIHMWVIATLFPLTAGTFGPMASMFNICAIAISWRVVVNPDSKESSGRHIPDPHWLVGVNIVSLVIAIIANISLLGQMTNRLRYNISGPITIVGFYISGLVDIALVSVAGSHLLPLPPTPMATMSQAFYYAAFSGAIYVILAMMLSVTAYGIWIGKSADEFKLSVSQRSLMLQTILFLTYVLAAGGVYCKIEGWNFLDAVYFTIVTLFTIGFGDLVPTTHLGRSLFFPMAVGGILFVGVIIANIRQLVLESGSVKVSTRLIEKARFQAIKDGRPEDGMLKLRGVRKRDMNASTEHERREKEFYIMREILQQAAMNNRLFSLAFAAIAFMILWFIGAVVFWRAESESVGGQNWTYFDALYFTFVAQLTIGYGDFEPQTNSAKPAFVFWALIALPTLTVLIGAIGDVVSGFVDWYTEWLSKQTSGILGVVQRIWARKDSIMEEPGQRDITKTNEDDDDLAFDDIANLEHQRTLPLELQTDSLTQLQIEAAEETYRPFVMLKAAQTVISHLNNDPPRQYTYKEWSWLLKLLGEDESDPKQHRRVGHPLPADAEIVEPLTEHERQMWSWLGQESPLMSQEPSEPYWVLRRLMQKLEQELKIRAEQRLVGEITAVTNGVPVDGVPHKAG